MSERTNNIIVQGSIPEFEMDGDDLDRIYLPVRGIQTGVRFAGQNETSLVVLPDTVEVGEFVKQTKTIFADIGLKIPDSVLVPDDNYFLDKAIEAHIELIRDKLNNVRDNHILWPYANTHVSDQWVSTLNRDGFKISNALPKREYLDHQTRSAWGRRIDSPNDPSFPERWGIPYPVSYIAKGESQLLEAYNRVRFLTGSEHVWLKLSASAGGFGVMRVGSECEVTQFYREASNNGSLFLFGDKDNELDIEVQEHIENLVGFGSYQYNGGLLETPGGISVQILDDKNWVGNKFNILNGRLSERAMEIHKNFSDGMRNEHPEDFYGWGGIDLGVTKFGDTLDLVVVENNWGRITGAHPAIYFAKALGISDRPFMVRKLKPPKVDAIECWRLLKSEGLAYSTDTKKGAVPIPWVREVDAFIFVVGESESAIDQITDKIMNLTTTNGYH